jgi:hypothetical protein
MQIHEITSRQYLGEVSSAVKQVWGQIAGDVTANVQARYTKDPRYVNLPLAQRIDVMRRDAEVKEIGQAAAEAWNQQVSGLMYRNQNQPLDDKTYQANLQAWINNNYFDKKLNNIDPASRTQALQTIQNITTNRSNPQLVADGVNKLIAISATTKMAPPPAPAPAPAKQPPIKIGQDVYVNKGRGYVNNATGAPLPPSLAQRVAGIK